MLEKWSMTVRLTLTQLLWTPNKKDQTNKEVVDCGWIKENDFLGCTHDNIWTLDTQEEPWAKKTSFASLKNFDWTHINEPLVKELICSFDYDNQYVKLERQHIDIGEESIAKVFKLPCEGLMVGSWEGYNGVAATYFTWTQQDHHVLKSRYVIAHANEKARVTRLEALTEILTFRQGKMFVLGFLVFMMLNAKKELVN